MDTEKRWARPVLARDQGMLYISLDELVSHDHPIRIVDAVLSKLDWSLWEEHYSADRRGQAPIHPQLLAGCILYGLTHKIRSSRDLEEATRERLDFRWFLEGRTIDHSTFAAFRTNFTDLLKDLNRDFARQICSNYEDALEMLVIDGTRIRANSDRHGARTAQGLERMIERCTLLLNERLKEMTQNEPQQSGEQQEIECSQENEPPQAPNAPQATNASQASKSPITPKKKAETPTVEAETNHASSCPGPPVSEQTKEKKGKSTKALQAEIAQLKNNILNYKKALEKAKAGDARRRKKDGKNARAISVPVNDLDSLIVPNKEGGFAPNHTPTVTIDAASGALIFGEVVQGTQENASVLPALNEARDLGGDPKGFMGDTAFGCGPNLEMLKKEKVEPCMPTGTDFRASNPANRPDPTQPVAQERWAELPKDKKKFRSSAFIYDSEQDQYYCPMGKALLPQGSHKRRNGSKSISYKCPGAQGCPLAKQCIGSKDCARTVTRDQYQDLRDECGRRMASEAAIDLYKKRAPLVETVFARIKVHMGVRGFLLRGREKVQAEWNWVCCAYNLKILIQRAHRMAREGHNEALQALLGAYNALFCFIRAMTPDQPSQNLLRKRLA